MSKKSRLASQATKGVIRTLSKPKPPGAKDAGLSPCPPVVSPLVIEHVSPCVDGGLFAVKSIVGKPIKVGADIFNETHKKIGACLRYRLKKETAWKEIPMTAMGNDRWEADWTPDKNNRYVYNVMAWTDPVATWLAFMEKKCPANLNVLADLAEGVKLLEELIPQVTPEDAQTLEYYRKQLILSEGISEEVLCILHHPEFREAVLRHTIRRDVTVSQPELELMVDRTKAEFSAWYEMFPRSQTKSKNKSGTFKDCIKRLPEIKKMGFDVIYLPPIHPIGTTNRKGRNNTLKAQPGDPGSPWAIGNKEGGHKAVHPDLGTLTDFDDFVSAAQDYGIEIALDFAIQCSPDHPYVKEHPEWFYRLPDGTIRYAENPPKKYEDIYPLNFYGEHTRELWEELRSIVLFWIRHGVKIFRVDNPHTKPMAFWKWMIETVQEKHPEVIFLAEAFTRPKVMQYLAKSGFTQSYTYFTWRNAKWELRQYLEELTQGEMKHYFRGNFFANTPDILTEILQRGGGPAFKMRLVLAATLSSVYGIYSGFEVCENRALKPGSEEYLDSEKYEIKVWDWDRPGNIRDFVSRINRIRAENPALHGYSNLEFYHSCNDQVLCYGKRTPDNSNIIVVVVNLDPARVHEDKISLPIRDFGIEDWQTYQMKDLITGEKYQWKGAENYLRLDPQYQPAHIFLLRK